MMICAEYISIQKLYAVNDGKIMLVCSERQNLVFLSLSITKDAILLKDKLNKVECALLFIFISSIEIHEKSPSSCKLTLKFHFAPTEIKRLNSVLANSNTCSEYQMTFTYNENNLRILDQLFHTKAATKTTRKLEISSPSLIHPEENMQILIEDDKDYSSSCCDEEVLFIYPFSGKDAITVTKNDVLRLEEKKYLNDTVIDFYLRYLTKINQSKSKDINVFDTLLYSTLLNCWKNNNFEYIKNWKKFMDITKKKAAVFPINEANHWFLVIVVDPIMAIRSPNCKKLEETNGQACRIFVFDSLHAIHKQSIDVLKWFLQNIAEKNFNSIVLSEKIEVVNVKVQKQKNFFDCGLFVLQYFESFLNDSFLFYEYNFETKKVFATKIKTWFNEAEMVSKRGNLKTLIERMSALYRSRETNRVDRDAKIIDQRYI